MIRKANSNDLDRIMEIVHDSIKQMQDTGNDQWDESYPLRSHYESDIKEDALYVYEEKNHILGVACYSEKDHEMYVKMKWSRIEPSISIKRIAVDPKTRGKGIGLDLYKFAEKIALQKGIYFLKTDTYEKNKSALRLFETSGYQFVERGYEPNKEFAFLCYEKILTLN